jgi:hypothetical protein
LGRQPHRQRINAIAIIVAQCSTVWDSKPIVAQCSAVWGFGPIMAAQCSAVHVVSAWDISPTIGRNSTVATTTTTTWSINPKVGVAEVEEMYGKIGMQDFQLCAEIGLRDPRKKGLRKTTRPKVRAVLRIFDKRAKLGACVGVRSSVPARSGCCPRSRKENRVVSKQ